MPSVQSLKIKLYLDGADRETMLASYRDNLLVKGFTTNPSLMAKAGVKDYRGYAKELLKIISDKPISFEVFADNLPNMERQAMQIKTWGENVYVKIPVQNTKGESCCPLVKKLAHQGVKLNVTALTYADQVKEVCDALSGGADSIVSVFAGRVADTGVDPLPMVRESARLCAAVPNAELLWASTREVYNIFQAEECGCKIITAPVDVLKKLSGVGKSAQELSLDTVRTFYKDATQAGFNID